MKYPAFLLLFALTLPVSLCAQSATPLFETIIRFKDGVGNRDSVVIGYDPSVVSYDTAQFHQILLNTPFDSVFEVRVVDWTLYRGWGNDHAPTYKRFFSGAKVAIDPPWCTVGGNFVFLIRAIHQPVTVYWDRNAFHAAHCRDNAYFTPDMLSDFADPFSIWLNSPDIIYSCAPKADSMVYQLQKEVYVHGQSPFAIPFFPYISLREIGGFGIDTIVGIKMNISSSYDYSPCHLVSAEEAALPLRGDAPLILSPNPTSGAFNVRNDRAVDLQQLRLFDSAGRLLWARSCRAAQGEFAHGYADGFPPGMYYVAATWADGYEAMGKLAKM